ncbi:MAG: hypothetical protein ACI81P_002169 [Neolewinella sp.]|jgi:hypothetical protein
MLDYSFSRYDMPGFNFMTLGPEDLYKAHYIIQEAQ